MWTPGGGESRREELGAEAQRTRSDSEDQPQWTCLCWLYKNMNSKSNSLRMKPSSGCRKTGRKLSCFPLYAAFVFGGWHLMNKRAKFELKKPLVLWSLTLAVFSIFGALRTGAYMVYTVMTKGLKHSVCDQGFYNGPVSKFWAYAFVLSKAPELGECLFSFHFLSHPHPCVVTYV